MLAFGYRFAAEHVAWCRKKKKEKKKSKKKKKKTKGLRCDA